MLTLHGKKVIGAKTAIHRKKLSNPVSWLIHHHEHSNHFLHEDHSILDFGCGHGKDADIIGWSKYDPATFPVFPRQQFDGIVCVYVLCILPDDHRKAVLIQLNNLLKDDGKVFIAVRADLKQDRPGKGCIQRNIFLDHEITYANGSFRCWLLNKEQLKCLV